MAFEGLLGTALKGTAKVAKGAFVGTAGMYQLGKKTGVNYLTGQFAKGFAIGAGKTAWAGVKAADKVLGEAGEIMMREVGTGKGLANRARDVAHVGAVNLIPIAAVGVGLSDGVAGQSADILLGDMSISRMAGSIHPGTTPNLERTKAGLYNMDSKKIPTTLDYAYRNGETLDDMLNGSGGDLALALSNNSRGGGF